MAHLSWLLLNMESSYLYISYRTISWINSKWKLTPFFKTGTIWGLQQALGLPSRLSWNMRSSGILGGVGPSVKVNPRGSSWYLLGLKNWTCTFSETSETNYRPITYNVLEERRSLGFNVNSKIPELSIFLNLLTPTGHVMHQQFNIQQFYVLPTLYLCVLYLSENKQRLVPLTA